MKTTTALSVAFLAGLQLVIAQDSASPSSTSDAPTGTPVKNSGKRGLCYTNDTLTLPYSLSGHNSSVSWEYDYYYSRYTNTSHDNDTNPALTFIPLMFNAAPDLAAVWPAKAQAAIDAGADAILSFNEPDGCYNGGQACMTVNQSVAAYKAYIQPFGDQVRLGAPAVTNGGPPSSLEYLQNFMGNCTGCQVDFITLHWYSNVYAFSYLQSYIESAYAQFGLPIWLTEFGIDSSGGTEAQYESFLRQSLAWLDAVPSVERYAYFFDGPGAGFLIESNGTMSGLSPLGEIYDSYSAPCPNWNNSNGTC